MRPFIALIHKESDSDYGVSFPDLPGCVATGPAGMAAGMELKPLGGRGTAGDIGETSRPLLTRCANPGPSGPPNIERNNR